MIFPKSFCNLNTGLIKKLVSSFALKHPIDYYPNDENSSAMPAS
jgi:hypothetical protein